MPVETLTLRTTNTAEDVVLPEWEGLGLEIDADIDVSISALLEVTTVGADGSFALNIQLQAPAGNVLTNRQVFITDSADGIGFQFAIHTRFLYPVTAGQVPSIRFSAEAGHADVRGILTQIEIDYCARTTGAVSTTQG